MSPPFKPRRKLALPRRQFVVLASATVVALETRLAFAADATVPIDLQVKLTAKVAGYDRNMEKRAGSRVLTLIVAARGNAESERAVARLRSAFDAIERIVDKPHETATHYFQSAPEVASECRNRKAAIVYITPGLDDQIPALKSSLTGIDVLSVGVDPTFVAAGIVLGFKLVSGKPKILVNLAQAKQQNVAFSASLLKLAEVIR